MPRIFIHTVNCLPASCIAVMAMLSGNQTQARQLLPGEIVVISNPSPAETWAAGSASSLTINGGVTLSISASGASSVVLNGVSTTGSSGPSAVQITNSTAEINASTILGNRTGLNVARVSGTTSGSVVNANDSVISGVNGGAAVSSYSTLNLSNTQVFGTGASSFGVVLAGGNVNASANSVIAGEQNGVVFRADPTDTQSNTLTLNKSHVQSTNGAAILVDVPSVSGSTVQIDVKDGSTIVGGNGVILDVRGGAITTMNVERSALSGDIISDSVSNTSVVLGYQAVLNGRMENVANVSINDSGRWNVTGASDVGALQLNGGTVSLQSGLGFYQLNIASLSGSEGTFALKTDFTTGQTDSVNIVGNASGNHNLQVASSGVDAPSGQPITLVRTGGGDAQFRLSNGSVDLGAFRYQLASSGNEWFLDPTTRTISPGARSVLALFNTAIPVWYGDMAPVHTRLGELRSSENNAGAWGRVYGKKYNVADGSGVGYQQTQRGFSLGWDIPLPSFADGQWLIGIMAGHSDSDLDLDYGTSGEIESNYLGAYATWVDRASGYYFDGLVKYNHYRNEAKVSLSDGTRAEGSNNTSGIGWESEFGRHIMLTEKSFIEPFARLSAVVIQGDDFRLDNGMDAKGDAARSLLGSVGMKVGRTFNVEKNVSIQPYLKGSLEHEFAENNEVKVNDNVFNNNLSGSRVAWGTGLAVSVSKSLQGHAEFDYIKGRNFEQPYGFSLGLRYLW
ncbi:MULTISPECIES: autotransporter outer membrane beta-barrel domain-containing protein [unclassified Pseudomonas]|uniref:autotransporter outer membrane beta-barrel domain-containing protein n=1 Tax=unclassified Pseudomonas TaxID=196821 RepID=UPI001F56789D|nr:MULTISPECIES: autotransporter outer membrane beta-barrel domain-containing protein [unclassified Pseudomonas]